LITSDRKVMVYDTANRAPRAVEELRNIFIYRSLVAQLVRRNILTRYKRSVLGVAWTMINPLGTMLILALVFSQVFDVEGYAAYILTGLMAWNFFSQTTVACMVDLMWGSQLLHRIFVPRTAFALAAIGTGLVNLTLALVPLTIVLLITGIKINWSILFLPVPMLLLACFALGFGLFISAFSVYFPDVSEMYNIILLAWFYLTPIIYPEEVLPEKLQYLISHLNPMYGLVKLYRMPLYDGRLPTWEEFWPSLVLSVTVLILGWLFFTYKSDEFSYRL
jgi:ABC-type polysaccharide/polyol phosphate export permease